MQLSAPSFPCNVNAAGPSVTKNGRSADNTSAGSPGFGDLLNAETGAAASRGPATGKGTSKTPPDARTKPELSDVDDSTDTTGLCPADDGSAAVATTSSWMLPDVMQCTPAAPDAACVATFDPTAITTTPSTEDPAVACDETANAATFAVSGANPRSSEPAPGFNRNGIATVVPGVAAEDVPSAKVPERQGSHTSTPTTTNSAAALPQRGENPTSASSVAAGTNVGLGLATDLSARSADFDGRPRNLVSARQDHTASLTVQDQDRAGAVPVLPVATGFAMATPSNSVTSATPLAADVAGAADAETVPDLTSTDATDESPTTPDEFIGGSRQPRGLPASAVAEGVHEAIGKARSQGVPPSSFIAEKFAAETGGSSETPSRERIGGQRKTLDVMGQTVTSRYQPVGINVAKAEATMTASSTFAPPPAGAAEAMSFAASPIAFDSLVSAESDNAALVSGARKAVESAVALTERFASTDRNSVNLQFKVSGVDLAVRVEMRADGVHTTFRTESPELRAALAQEWQAVTAQTPDRAVRLVEPTFSSNSTSGGLSSDTSSAHQRQPDARQPEAFSSQFNLGRNLPRVTPAAVASTAVPSSRSVAPGRLHTFA